METGDVNGRVEFGGSQNEDANQAASSNNDTSVMADVEVIEVGTSCVNIIDLTESPDGKDMLANNNTANKRIVSPPLAIQCPICFESYLSLLKNGLHLVSSNCGHIFCSSCLPQMNE